MFVLLVVCFKFSTDFFASILINWLLIERVTTRTKADLFALFSNVWNICNNLIAQSCGYSFAFRRRVIWEIEQLLGWYCLHCKEEEVVQKILTTNSLLIYAQPRHTPNIVAKREKARRTCWYCGLPFATCFAYPRASPDGSGDEIVVNVVLFSLRVFSLSSSDQSARRVVGLMVEFLNPGQQRHHHHHRRRTCICNSRT